MPWIHVLAGVSYYTLHIIFNLMVIQLNVGKAVLTGLLLITYDHVLYAHIVTFKRLYIHTDTEYHSILQLSSNCRILKLLHRFDFDGFNESSGTEYLL